LVLLESPTRLCTGLDADALSRASCLGRGSNSKHFAIVMAVASLPSVDAMVTAGWQT